MQAPDRRVEISPSLVDWSARRRDQAFRHRAERGDNRVLDRRAQALRGLVSYGVGRRAAVVNAGSSQPIRSKPHVHVLDGNHAGFRFYIEVIPDEENALDRVRS